MKLLALSQRKAFRDRALVAAFEGHDAAGKGGAIRRVTMALDPRQYRVYPVAAPTDEEKGRPYLWRFWRHVPRQGRIAIFDRSWYGRVLVERVEGFASPARVAPRLWRDQRFRGGAGPSRHRRRQVLAGDRQGRAAAPVRGARRHGVQAVQDHARGLAQPREVGPLPRRHRRDDRPHQHAQRALDPGRGARQALGAGQGPGDAGRAARGRALARAQNQHRPETSSVGTLARPQRVEHLPGAGHVLAGDAELDVGLADQGDLDQVGALRPPGAARATATRSRSTISTTDAASSGSTVCCSSSMSAAAAGAAAIARTALMARCARIIPFPPRDQLAAAGGESQRR